MRVPVLILILSSVLLCLTACKDDSPVNCAASTDCSQAGIPGACLPSPASTEMWCAFPDTTCSSGSRWGILTGDGLAGACTPEIDAGPTGADAAGADADAAVLDADVDADLRTWSEPTLLLNVNSSGFDGMPSISADGLTLYFSSNRPGGMGLLDIYVASRPSKSAAFGAATSLTVVNSGENERSPEISTSGLELYFDRAGTPFVSTRPTAASAWGAPVQVPMIGTIKSVSSASLTADGLTMYFKQSGATACGSDGACVKRITRTAIGQPWSAVPDAPEPLGGLKYNEVDISADGLSIVLSSPSIGSLALAVESSRSSIMSNFVQFDTLVNLLEPSTTGLAWNADETELYMSIDPGGGVDDQLYVSVLQ